MPILISAGLDVFTPTLLFDVVDVVWLSSAVVSACVGKRGSGCMLVAMVAVTPAPTSGETIFPTPGDSHVHVYPSARGLERMMVSVLADGMRVFNVVASSSVLPWKSYY